MTVTVDKLIDQRAFDNAVLAITTDATNSMSFGSFETFGNRVRKIALEILSKQQTDSYESLHRVLINKVYDLMNSRKSLTKETEKQTLFRELNVYQFDRSNHKIFEHIYPNFDTEEFRSMLNSLLLNIMTEILKLENETEKQPTVEVNLTTEEQQVLRYSAGYIIFSMRRKYLKLSKSNVNLTKTTANAALKFVESVIEEYNPDISGENYLEFTQKWVELRNRGGLVELSNDFYLFIRRVEGFVKGILNVNLLRTYKSEDLRDILMDKIENSDGVSKKWDILTRNFDGENLKKMLKKQIISKWIDIRARSFVKGFIELLKQVSRKQKLNNEDNKTKGTKKAKTVSTKAEVALRKKL